MSRLSSTLLDLTANRMWIASVVLGMVLLVPAEGQSQGLVQSLPADGQGVKYRIKIEHWRDGQPLNVQTGSLSVVSVGRTVRDELPCRWLEFQLTTRAEGAEQEFLEVTKYLIPEEVLGPGNEPLLYVVESWRKDHKGEITPAGFLRSGLHPSFTDDLWLPSPMHQRKLAETQDTVELGGKQIQCTRIVTGTSTWEGMVGRNVLNTTTTHRMWLAEAIPFGVAKSVHDFRFEISGTQRHYRYSLEAQDVIENAETALPDHD